MDNGTTLLGLDGLVVEQVRESASGLLEVWVVTSTRVQPRCPLCSTVSGSVKQWTTTRPWDIDIGGHRVRLRWRKRRWRCQNPLCPRGSFTETVVAIGVRSRMTVRLRQLAGATVADRGATVVQAARDLGLSWSTVQAALAAHAVRVLPARHPQVDVLGIDETRRGRRRYTRDPVTGQLVLTADCWHTGFCDVGGGQGLLDQVEGRDADTVTAWLLAQPADWRARIRFVAIDMSVSYAAAVRMVLPNAFIVVDHFHIVQLANQALAVAAKATRNGIHAACCYATPKTSQKPSGTS